MITKQKIEEIVRNEILDVVEPKTGAYGNIACKAEAKAIDQLYALIQEERKLWEKEKVELRADIGYAIGHGQGCGHNIAYLEKKYKELDRD